ncbi:metal tolerance protein 2-like [Telopea speciosissima]|uniref:metal tolerance protein 2-like n=1 Tax=Telopea speciosissima TaxID=54955 RepID=UPI001CC57930|nr:metal tolerance protein 2-like [Telopea speciosissima]XP_043718842.1 metal tolerance protein 2-like [Telopea speciosissima]
MGFRFSILSPIYKAYISRISSPSSPHTRTRFNYLLLPSNSHLQDSLVFSDNYHPHYNIPRRWHVGHSHHHHHHSGEEGENIFKLGLAADVALATGKVLTGYLSGSTAIIADAAHSVSDIVLSGVALWSFQASRAPKDKEHPYGHGKFETLGALGISCMLLATAGGIAWHALDILQGVLTSTSEMANHSSVHEHLHIHGHGGHHHGIDMAHPILALNMTIVSIVVKEGLFWITKRAGEKQGSGLMKANAWHHRVDAVSSIVALIGVGGSILGVKFLDPLAGLIVSGMILKAGVENGYQSVMELVDAGVEPHLLDLVKQTILQVEGVRGCHHLRGRKAGSCMHLDVHIEVDPFLSVSAAHEIGENVRRQIQRSHTEVAEVFIHIDPAISQFSSQISNLSENAKGMDLMNLNVCSKKNDVETVVSDILASKFTEKMVVEHITRHQLQGNILLEVEVSMPDEMLIRNAIEVAKGAEKEILKTAPNVNQVSILLRLGHPIARSKTMKICNR